MQPKISVIIPVYNVEKYLKECLDSVVNQTLKDVEIICVDDGSIDSSGKILDEYAAKDNRIKVIHKENGGYGKAMNTGLDNATGEYIGIVEPDDYIELNMYEELYKKASQNNLNFIKCNYYKYSTRATIKNELCVPFNKERVYNKVIKPIDYIETFNGAASIWAGMYNQKFLKDNDIRFLETPGASFQDTSFWIKVLFDAQKGMFTEDVFNHYRVDNVNSSVKSNSKIFCICDEMHSLEDRYKDDLNKIKIINTLKIDKYTWNYNRLNEKGQKQFFKTYYKEIHPLFNKNLYVQNFILESVVARSKSILKSRRILPKFFSVKNQGIHKIISLFSLKFKIKSQRLIERERYRVLEANLNHLLRNVEEIRKLLSVQEKLK